MERITTVTCNAAIDKMYRVPAFRKGAVMRASAATASAGGKGINVVRVLRQLGHAQLSATGFIAGQNGKFIAEQTAALGVDSAFVEVPGESRLCLNMIDETDGSSTELLEAGPDIDADGVERLKRRIGELAATSGLVILSGSLPRGVPQDLYAELTAIARGAGAEVFLDTSGLPLREGIGALPGLIKPNEDEILPWIPDGAGGEAGIAAAIRLLTRAGVRRVIVTLGADGAIAGIDERLFRIRLPHITAVNTVGSGDAFIAGFAFGFVRGLPPADCLRHAAAAGSANALTARTGEVNSDDFLRLLPQVTVEERME